MSLRFQILGSSSSGNCAFLQTGDCRILIDAGFSARRIGELLEDIGEHPENLDAVFVTHEHSDHVAGIRGLSRQPNLEVFANAPTAQAVRRGLKREVNWRVFETGTTIRFRDLEIESFSVPHDAYDPVGFLFRQGGDLFHPEKSVAWITDLGHVPQLVREKARGAHILVLESNHCPRLLQRSERPWSLKQRIASRHGHLSNEAASDWLRETENPAWRQVFLGHLSNECNSVAAVEEAFAFARGGGVPWELDIIESGRGGRCCEL